LSSLEVEDNKDVKSGYTITLVSCPSSLSPLPKTPILPFLFEEVFANHFYAMKNYGFCEVWNSSYSLKIEE
jgi:hypothetical protein